MVRNFLIVLLVVYEIYTDVCLNSFVMNFVSFPKYVKLARMFLLL